jgi:hypothetical protein
MEWFKFLEGKGNENNKTISIFYVVSNKNIVTITFCSNNAQLGYKIFS